MSESEVEKSVSCGLNRIGDVKSDIGQQQRQSDEIATSGGVSRRRLMFRPHSLLPSTVSTTSAALSQNSTVSTAEEDSSNSNSKTTKTLRKWGQWSETETTVFFEGIKQFGKDFDQIAKLMAKKKLNKDKDQIRNYYFNTYKLLRTNARISEDFMADIPRDARELFIVINGCEWRRKTGDLKVENMRLMQLIREGSTNVRIKKKKQTVNVRTPICPSLLRFFPSKKMDERLPSHVIIQLSPKYEKDRFFVESCGHNPFVRIRASINSQLRQIFSLLNAKWIPPLIKTGLAEGVVNEWNGMKLQFFPDVSTQLADVSARRVQSSLPAMPCLKRLRLENLKRSDEDAESVEENGKLSGRAVESHSQKNQTDDQPASSTSSTFSVLDVSKLRNGLSESMVDDISITELFYLCGMNPEIHLLYSTNVERNSSREPWKEFVSLISRNYGSSLCKNIDGPEDVDEVRQVMVTLEDRKRKEKTLISGSTSNNKETDIGQTEDDPQKGSTTNAEGSSNSVKPVSAPIVECENRAFMRQLEGLQLKKRPRTLVVQPSKNGTSLAASMKRFHHASSSNETALVNQQQQPVAGTYISEPPISIGSAGRVQQAAATHYVVLPPNTQIVQGPPSFIGTVGSGSVTQFFNFPTVSAVGTVRQMNSSEMNRTPEREAESHRQHEFSATPNTQFAAQVLTTMSGQVEPTTSTSNDDLFSDSYCVSNTNGAEHSTVYPIFAVPQDSVHYVIVDQSSTNSLSISPEKIFTELNTVDVNMGASAVSSTCADISQNSSNKTLGNLPDDVRHSFEMCMQQNSIDYCRNFEQLVTSFETTPKNAP